VIDLKKPFWVTAILFVLLTGCLPNNNHEAYQGGEPATKVVAGLPVARYPLQIIPTPKSIIAVLASDQLFEPDSAAFTPQHTLILNQVLQLVNDHPETHHINIQAFTDDLNITPKSQKNTLLQANIVAAFLWEHGVPHHLISAKGCAGHRSVSKNSSATGRADNRRIEITLTHDLIPPLG
jgi:flagellar motor protein MotB